MRIALAQINPLVGDLPGNAARIFAACQQSQQQSEPADLLLTPELSLWGYPPRDLLLNPSGVAQQQTVMDHLSQDLHDLAPALAVLVGVVEPAGDSALPHLFNAVALIQGGRWRVVGRKQLLPSYDVFDESRYFRAASGPSCLTLNLAGQPWRLGLTICEDLWVEPTLQNQRLTGPDPVAALEPLGVDLLLNLSASPFAQEKSPLRRELAARAAARLNCPVIYVNQVGGNDELIFDGGSFVIDRPRNKAQAAPTLTLQLPICREALDLWDAGSTAAASELSRKGAEAIGHDHVAMSREEQLLRALVLGVHDYAGKCGFQHALLGLSGGIDSALVAVIACAALGADRVQALLMPSPWSSRGSIEDAAALAQRLGLHTDTTPIEALMDGFAATLTPVLQGPPADVTAENLQSRIRGTLLMAVANQQGQLLLSTGNKSELAVGYCTLYGDMNGGLAVIGDLYKSTVFALCDWLDNPASQACRRELGLPASGELVGRAIREKPPSAELRPDQKDSDSLPDYAMLDPLLRDLIEEHCGEEALLQRGHAPDTVTRVLRLFRRAEFKRRQAPPLLKVSRQAFGTGWRLPIAAV